ncbi:putative Restriction of telomere capping 5 protein [Rutstroemia sp. NJR-2017a WRK4]|nr:putative Restriction of telomere capping 5 protein [Rutstroemia sp. NJR-2017a WRK4]PQE11803.1 putative Restriction of telomere capping 5 protein [Rutstroemia sp. NJR-2017a WRK4]
MGQGQSGNSAKHVTTEQLSHELARKFAKRCFTSLELYSFQDVFRSLADNQDGVAYLKEDTIARFLEIPDILGVSSFSFRPGCAGCFGIRANDNGGCDYDGKIPESTEEREQR